MTDETQRGAVGDRALGCECSVLVALWGWSGMVAEGMQTSTFAFFLEMGQISVMPVKVVLLDEYPLRLPQYENRSSRQFLMTSEEHRLQLAHGSWSISSKNHGCAGATANLFPKLLMHFWLLEPSVIKQVNWATLITTSDTIGFTNQSECSHF